MRRRGAEHGRLPQPVLVLRLGARARVRAVHHAHHVEAAREALPLRANDRSDLRGLGHVFNPVYGLNRGDAGSSAARRVSRGEARLAFNRSSSHTLNVTRICVSAPIHGYKFGFSAGHLAQRNLYKRNLTQLSCKPDAAFKPMLIFTDSCVAPERCMVIRIVAVANSSKVSAIGHWKIKKMNHQDMSHCVYIILIQSVNRR